MPNAFQFTVSFHGSGLQLFIGVCMMKYWEASKTDSSVSVNIKEVRNVLILATCRQVDHIINIYVYWQEINVTIMIIITLIVPEY